MLIKQNNQGTMPECARAVCRRL